MRPPDPLKSLFNAFMHIYLWMDGIPAKYRFNVVMHIYLLMDDGWMDGWTDGILLPSPPRYAYLPYLPYLLMDEIWQNIPTARIRMSLSAFCTYLHGFACTCTYVK